MRLSHPGIEEGEEGTEGMTRWSRRDSRVLTTIARTKGSRSGVSASSGYRVREVKSKASFKPVKTSWSSMPPLTWSDLREEIPEDEETRIRRREDTMGMIIVVNSCI